MPHSRADVHGVPLHLQGGDCVSLTERGQCYPGSLHRPGKLRKCDQTRADRGGLGGPEAGAPGPRAPGAAAQGPTLWAKGRSRCPPCHRRSGPPRPGTMAPWKGPRPHGPPFGVRRPGPRRLAAWPLGAPADKAGSASPRVPLQGLVAAPREGPCRLAMWLLALHAASLAGPPCAVPAHLAPEPGVRTGARSGRGGSGDPARCGRLRVLGAPSAPTPALVPSGRSGSRGPMFPRPHASAQAPSPASPETPARTSCALSS